MKYSWKSDIMKLNSKKSLVLWDGSSNGHFLLPVYEPPCDKTNKMSVCPAKTQISLGICPV